MKHNPILAVLLLACSSLAAQPPQALTVTPEQQIQYNPYPNRDRIPDYSFCGYKASEAPIPDLLADPSVPVVRVSPSGGDDTQRIQDALDHVGALPLRADGFRGLVLLEAGTFRLDGSLLLSHGGVVLRGSGDRASTLFAAGTDRETVLRISGRDDATAEQPVRMTAEYLPATGCRPATASGLPARPRGNGSTCWAWTTSA